MSHDITRVLSEWDYDPERPMVRIIQGEDGRQKIQLRLDLGLLQMEVDGRPDGRRPEGYETFLDYCQARQQAHDEAHPDSAPFTLSERDCALLWQEGVQFYHRYLSFWHLERYPLCARDTLRNLELFAFVRQHTHDDRLKMQFDQWRPYVLMMHSRAVATPLVQAGQAAEALKVIESGIDAIRDFLDEYGQGHRAEECVELVNLERWREEVLELAAEQPSSNSGLKVQVLRRRLDEAVAHEEFEEAARLRDEIRRLSDPPID